MSMIYCLGKAPINLYFLYVHLHVYVPTHQLGMSMLDIVCSENDPVSLCNVFKHWLLDCSTDTEHLNLCLPACLGDTPIILKCDLQERLINPMCLPHAGEKFVSVRIC